MIRRIIRALYLNSVGRVERLIKIQHRNAVKATVVLSNMKVGGKSISGSINKSFEE